MREYDTTLIVQPEISEDAREAMVLKLGEVLEKAGAIPLEVDDIGKRKLAYDIRKFQKGHYMSLFFLDDGGKAVPELERTLRFDESILRFLTVRKDEDIDDVDLRKARAVEAERIRKERAVERAEREAEERAAREAARVEEEKLHAQYEADAKKRAEAEAEAEAKAEAKGEEETDADSETLQTESATASSDEQSESAAPEAEETNASGDDA